MEEPRWFLHEQTLLVEAAAESHLKPSPESRRARPCLLSPPVCPIKASEAAASAPLHAGDWEVQLRSSLQNPFVYSL